MERKRHAVSKPELIKEIQHWKWQAQSLQEGNPPWLMVPGLIVYLDTSDLRDIEVRIELLDLAFKQVRRNALVPNDKVSVAAGLNE